MKSAKPAIPIPNVEIARFVDQATNPLITARWKPGRIRSGTPAEISLGGVEVAQELNPGVIALSIGNEKGLPNEDGVHIMHAIRRGIQIGYFVSESYEKQIQLDALLAKKRSRTLSADKVTEFEQKNVTSAAILVFVAADYALWKLRQYKPETIAGIAAELPITPEVSLSDPPGALQCFAYYLGRVLSEDGKDGTKLVKTGSMAVKMAIVYLERVIEEVKLRVGANTLLYTDPFVDNSYKLEDEDFIVSGFEANLNGVKVSAAFNPAAFDDIVGNRDAKHAAERAVNRLLCFDFKERRNPFLDAFGDFPLIRMGKGIPGTGKTLQARAIITRIAQKCEPLGIPYLFWQLPNDIGSEFQSKSQKNMDAWTKEFSDTSRLIYGLIDDAENVLKTREGSNTAESIEGIISVFLRFSEGAGASRVGNWFLDVLTNLPEKMDQAVMSRIQERFDINGAETVEDFLDQDHIWTEQVRRQEEKAGVSATDSFIDMRDPPGYVYMSSQGHLVSMSQLYDGKPVVPEGDVLRRIFEELRREHKTDEMMFYAKLFHRMREEFPRHFSSRDVRNIQVAINNRRTDFDLPDEWFEKREHFVELPYLDKVRLLVERQRESLKGLRLSAVRLQETIRYLNVTLSIPENARRREIESARDEMIKNFDAKREAKAMLLSTGRVKNDAEAEAA